MVESIELGKYTVISDNNKGIIVTKDGWIESSYLNSRAMLGDKLILAMFNRIKELEKSIEEYKYDIEHGLAR